MVAVLYFGQVLCVIIFGQLIRPLLSLMGSQFCHREFSCQCRWDLLDLLHHPCGHRILWEAGTVFVSISGSSTGLSFVVM
jgi:hypothetical protein